MLFACIQVPPYASTPEPTTPLVTKNIHTQRVHHIRIADSYMCFARDFLQSERKDLVSCRCDTLRCRLVETTAQTGMIFVVLLFLATEVTLSLP